MSAPETKQQVYYRRLGSSGLKVSVPILGAMSFGNPEWQGWVGGEEQSLEVLKAAWDQGINTIDTSNNYSNGESERIVGKFLKKYNIPRNQFIIATKCYGLVSSDPKVFTPTAPPEFYNQREYVNQSGLSRAAIFNAVEASLERLQTTYIDLYQIHRFDPETPAEETMKALHDLVQSGKVRYIGASSMRTWQFAHLNEVASRNGWTRFVSMQNEYSLLYREEEREMLPYCKFHGIGVIPWSPLKSGVLSRPFDSGVPPRLAYFKGTAWEYKFSEADETIIRRVEEIAKKRGVSMAKVALAWLALKVTSPIIGTASLKRLEENIVSEDLVLTNDEAKYLEESYAPVPVQGHS
ncbi:hypothetical protein AAF712_006146 [Marasmius tenuissimus]|uniref:NADP-dependent oxidoreductase domain-containing protein n=1 Tax=Marasmius tenuissimus TaxID=585030 RepID=A0ABR2ZZQ8_9AGAR|nr:hypothetical protein PM082_018850 [Marasmius tenuissimus]